MEKDRCTESIESGAEQVSTGQVSQSYTDYEDGVSLKDVIDLFAKNIIFILVFSAITVLCGIAFVSYINRAYLVQTIIEFTYDGVMSGTNPDGTSFDINEINNVHILENALAKAGIENISATELRNNISITPVVPSNVDTLVENKLKIGEVYAYYPTQFKISLASDNRLSKEKATALCNGVIEEYKTWYKNTYLTANETVRFIEGVNFDEYDYPETVTILNGSITQFTNYLQSFGDEAIYFRSDETGYTIADIVALVNVLSNVELNSISSVVQMNSLTKDKASLIMKYKFLIQQAELEEAKKLSEAQAAMDLMSKYEEKTSTIVIPGISMGSEVVDGSVEESGKNSYYDTLADRSIAASVTASNRRHDIEFYTSEIARIENAEISSSERQKAVLEVNRLCESVKVKLTEYMSIAIVTIDEYFLTIDGFVKTLYPPVITHKFDYLLVTAASGLAGFIFAYLIVFTRYLYKREQYNKA